MSEIFVVDAGVLFSNWTQKNPSAQLITTDAVIEEVQNKPSQSRIESLLSLGRLRVIEPSSLMMKRVLEATEMTGDRTVLSKTDMGLIALALEYKESGESITLVSTDLAVLNTASHLGIRINDPSGKMRERRKWFLLCPACGHHASHSSEDLECPVCGTLMKRRVKKSRRLHE